MAWAIVGLVLGFLANYGAEYYTARRLSSYLHEPFTPRLFGLWGLLGALASALAFLTIYIQWDHGPIAWQLSLFFLDLLFLSRTDILAGIIPNGCILFAVILRALFFGLSIPFAPSLLGALGRSLLGLVVLGGIAALLGYGLSRKTGRQAIGGGDIKLFAVVGLFFGVGLGLVTMALASILALAINGIASRGKKREFPFGPFIAMACLIVVLFAAT